MDPDSTYDRLRDGLVAIRETSTDPTSRALAASMLAMLPLVINDVLNGILDKFNAQHDEEKHKIDYDRYCMSCTPAEQLVEEARLPFG